MSLVRSPAFRRKQLGYRAFPPEGGTTNLIDINKIVRRHQDAAQALPRLLVALFARELLFEAGDVVQRLIYFALIRLAIEDARVCGFNPRDVAHVIPVEQRFRDELSALVQEFAVEPEERLCCDIGFSVLR